MTWSNWPDVPSGSVTLLYVSYCRPNSWLGRGVSKILWWIFFFLYFFLEHLFFVSLKIKWFLTQINLLLVFDSLSHSLSFPFRCYRFIVGMKLNNCKLVWVFLVQSAYLSHSLCGTPVSIQNTLCLCFRIPVVLPVKLFLRSILTTTVYAHLVFYLFKKDKVSAFNMSNNVHFSVPVHVKSASFVLMPALFLVNSFAHACIQGTVMTKM